MSSSFHSWARGAAIAVTAAGAAIAVGGAVLTGRNLAWLQRRRIAAESWTPGPSAPSTQDETTAESANGRIDAPGTAPITRVAVLLPARNEEHRIRACAQSLARLEGLGVPTAAGTLITAIIVLDDNSEDGTAALVRDELGSTDVFTLLDGDSEPPAGWLGKPWACQRLAEHAGRVDADVPDVLVFVDADVVLEPHAVDAAVRMLNCHGIAATCPYPRQVSVGTLGRLVQPLLQWSWLSTLDLQSAERSRRPSTATGNGQFFAVRAEAYWAAGGHAAVRDDVLEDLALMRAIRRTGAAGGVSDGTDLATCTMYSSSAELVDGYTKSLWSAFGSTPGAIAAMALLQVAYLVPPLAAIFGRGPVRALGVIGTAGAWASRTAAALGTGQRVLPDVLTHPGSIVALGGLTAASIGRHRRGANVWKGRPVHLRSAPAST